MKKYFCRLAFFAGTVTIFAQNGVGINTDEPEATLDIYPAGKDTDGILFPVVNKFSSTDPGSDQNAMLVFLNRDPEDTGFEGLYFWDAQAGLWQYIFQSKMLDKNLFKTIVNENGSTTISSSNANTNVWFKTNLSSIEAPDGNYELDNGDLIIGKTGTYSLFFTGEVSKGAGDSSGTQTEVGIFLDGSPTPEVFSAIPLPAADNANRSVNHTLSNIIYLTKEQRISIQTRRMSNNTTSVWTNNFTLTFSYLD